VLAMSKSSRTEMEQEIGSVVWHSIARLPKKNHDAMVRIAKQFNDIFKKHGGLRSEVFQLTNTEAPMEGITNIAKIVSANQDEEVWMELQYYRDRKHLEEVTAKFGNDENMGRLYKQSVDLLSPGSSFIMGEFNRLEV
jgi:uncharacterized protein YbaA (DUF1428 family)